MSQMEPSARVVPLHRVSSGASSGSSGSVPLDEEVIALLKRAELPKGYAQSLRDLGFGTLSHLRFIMEGDLSFMPVGHRRAFLYHLEIWKQAQDRTKISAGPATPNNGSDRMLAGESAREIAMDASSRRTIHIDELRNAARKRDLEDGEELELKVPLPHDPKSLRVFTLIRTGNTYSCTCLSWRSLTSAHLPERRTCEHLKVLRGEEEEAKRVGQPRSLGGQDGVSEASSVSLDHEASLVKGGLTQIQRERLNAMRQERSKDSLLDFPPHLIVHWNELHMQEDILGEGSFGVVRIAEWRGSMVAVKEFKSLNPMSREQDVNDLKREALLMSRVCNHDNVVPLIGIVIAPVMAVVMKYMSGGSVEDLLVVPGPRNIRAQVPWYAVVKMLRDAAAGILHLHKQHVIHRDISARNLLVDATGSVRVSDFGFARVSEFNAGVTLEKTGPYKWMSPVSCIQLILQTLVGLT
jgi:hypothetical protein